MNFNALEFANTMHHNSYFPLIDDHEQTVTNSKFPDVLENSVEKEATSFFSTNNFLKKLASGQLFTSRSSVFSMPMQKYNEISNSIVADSSSAQIVPTTSTLGSNNIQLPQELLTNSIVLNASTFSEEAWHRQIEHDKFMNEIWIGIVLTLIIISMVFCICSCFLYHQFRLWKMNYRQSVQQNQDIESVKFNLEDDDPVPQYTLVSGLPTYEAALDMLNKSTNYSIQLDKLNNYNNNNNNNNRNCLSYTKTYPSVFSIFTKNEKSTELNNNNTTTNLIVSPPLPITSLSINDTIRKSLSSLSIEKISSLSSSASSSTLPMLVELKPLVKTVQTNNNNVIVNETTATFYDNRRETADDNNDYDDDENYRSSHSLTYNEMHRNSNDQLSSIALSSSSTSSSSSSSSSSTSSLSKIIITNKKNENHRNIEITESSSDDEEWKPLKYKSNKI